MSVKLYRIIEAIEKFAPLSLAAVWDNCGLIVGRSGKNVSKIILALDATPAVIKEAVNKEADLIVTHHPLTFNPVKNISDSTPIGESLLELAENKIALYSAHTNLDSCKGGVNDVLAELLGLEEAAPSFFDANLAGEKSSFGKTGYLDRKITLEQLAKRVGEALNDDTVTYTGDGGVMIGKVGCCSGSGGMFIDEAAKSGCEAFITGDIKYAQALQALSQGMSLVNFGHYQSEVIILNKLKTVLSEEFDDIVIEISSAGTLPFNIVGRTAQTSKCYFEEDTNVPN